MVENELIVQTIIKGAQELKGKKVVVVDMTSLNERACDYFVICEADSSTHVASIADSIQSYVAENIGVKPFAVDGRKNAEWIAFDYGQVFAHVFQSPARAFYDIEHLWADATINIIPDLN